MSEKKRYIEIFRINETQKKQIQAYCVENKIKNTAEFYRFAITKILNPDIEDKDLLYESLKIMHEKINDVQKQQEIIFSYTSFLARYFLSYIPEIPAEIKEAASISAIERHKKMEKSYQASLKNTPNMFEALLADYFETSNE